MNATLTVADALTHIRRWQQEEADATPGPWFYNSYSAIFSAPLCHEYDTLEQQIPDDDDDDDDRWKALPNPVVANVPKVAGDLATREGAVDARLIVTMRAAWPLVLDHWADVLERHQPKTTTPGYFCTGCTDYHWPCDEAQAVLDVIATLTGEQT